MKTSNSGGEKANRKGRSYESVVKSKLVELNIPFKQQVNYVGIYGSTLKMDFVICLKRFPKLGIEVKSQNSSGSVDEKFPYIVKNIKERSPWPAIVVRSLKGAKKESVVWLCNQVDGKKFVGCFDVGEFISWIHDQVYENE